MSRIWARLAGMLSNRRMVGVDKAGNRYFTRTEEIDGIIEWICWLNGQRKNAPTPEVYKIWRELVLDDKRNKRTLVSPERSAFVFLQEMAELEARRELVRLNVARLKEEEERLAKEGKIKVTSVGKLAAPDLKSFVRQFPDATEGDTAAEASNAEDESRSSEPSGSGESFRPGTWQPPI
nr:mimitin, mitochondrial isoform X1 [Ipomoea batatas]